MPSDPSLHEVSLYVEQEGTNKFKIQSGQLEQIGAQLRGRREFSIFQSIILPLIVSVATIVLSSAFQYVSWFNSVGLKDATDVADKAERTYETSAAAIGRRHYATFVFLPSLRDLVLAKANAVQSARAQANGLLSARAEATGVPSARTEGKGIKDIVSAQANAKKRNPDAERLLLNAVTQRTEDTRDNEISLHKSDLDIKQKRFASYYEQLKLWNESYDHVLSEIEYALDRPVFGQRRQKERGLSNIPGHDRSNGLFEVALGRAAKAAPQRTQLKGQVCRTQQLLYGDSCRLGQTTDRSDIEASAHLRRTDRIHNQKPTQCASGHGKRVSLPCTPTHRLLQRSKGAGHLQHRLCLEIADRCNEDRGAKTF